MKIIFLSQLHYFSCCLPDELVGHDIQKINLDFRKLDELRGLKADIIFLFRADFIPTDILRSMKGKLIYISTEPIERADVLPSMIKCFNNFEGGFHSVWHYDRTHIAELRKRLAIDVDEFILPVNLDSFFEVSSVLNRPVYKKFDLLFSGRSTPHREEYLSKIKRDYNIVHFAHGVIDNHLCYYINDSIINLNLHIDNYRQCQHRMQNMLACGAFVLSEPLTHNDCVIAGEHFVEFNSKAELENKIDYYLSHPEQMKEVAEAGMEFVRTNLNADIKWLELINQIA